MELTQDQLNELRKGLRGKGITYEELENELVDHLALTTEKYMKENGWGFNAALKKAFQEFGPYGFKTIQRNFEKLLLKRTLPLLIEQGKNFIIGRQLAITLSLLLVIWAVVTFYSGLLLPAFELSWLGLFLGTFAGYYGFRKQITKNSHKTLFQYLFSGVHSLNMLVMLGLILPENNIFTVSKPILGGSMLLFFLVHLAYWQTIIALKRGQVKISMANLQ